MCNFVIKNSQGEPDANKADTTQRNNTLNRIHIRSHIGRSFPTGGVFSTKHFFEITVLINKSPYGRIVKILHISRIGEKQTFQGGSHMELILASFAENLIKFIAFILVAWAGIVCGKKYRDHKDHKEKESK